MKIDIEQIKEKIADVLELDMCNITGDMDLIEDLGVNSIMILELIAELEDSFGIKISPSMIKDINTMDSLMNVIKKFEEGQ